MFIVPTLEIEIEQGLTSHKHRSYRDWFYGLIDPTNIVKALKEDRVLRIRLLSHQVRSTPPRSQ